MGTNPMSELTQAAKDEIKAAIAIVQQDKRDAMLREIHERTMNTPTPTPAPGPDPGPTPPPPTPPAPDPSPPRKDAYWGELLQ